MREKEERKENERKNGGGRVKEGTGSGKMKRKPIVSPSISSPGAHGLGEGAADSAAPGEDDTSAPVPIVLRIGISIRISIMPVS